MEKHKEYGLEYYEKKIIINIILLFLNKLNSCKLWIHFLKISITKGSDFAP